MNDKTDEINVFLSFRFFIKQVFVYDIKAQTEWTTKPYKQDEQQTLLKPNSGPIQTQVQREQLGF